MRRKRWIVSTGNSERDEFVERELEQALRTMHDAHRRNDLAYLDQAMAGDFTIIHANGDLLTKEEWFADLRSGATSWERPDVHDVESRVFGDLAVVHNR